MYSRDRKIREMCSRELYRSRVGVIYKVEKRCTQENARRKHAKENARSKKAKGRETHLYALTRNT